MVEFNDEEIALRKISTLGGGKTRHHCRRILLWEKKARVFLRGIRKGASK